MDCWISRQVVVGETVHRGAYFYLVHRPGHGAHLFGFMQNHFVDAYYPTIESTFAKSVKYKGVEYDCHIIDTAGQVGFFFSLLFFRGCCSVAHA